LICFFWLVWCGSMDFEQPVKVSVI
jgi:hypothetical protein